MSMTREEAIASYEKLYDYMVGDDDAIELDYGEFMELNHYIRSALRPVSREQGEKVWRGEWVEKPYSTKSERNRIINCKKYICSVCNKSNGRKKKNFCPFCGAPMTDEAVQMVMERLEALYESIHND